MINISNPHFCPDLLHEFLFWWRLFNLRIRGALTNNLMMMIVIMMVLISSFIVMSLEKIGIMDVKEERIAWTLFKVRF